MVPLDAPKVGVQMQLAGVHLSEWAATRPNAGGAGS